jgi:TRAP-type mannitol/chloroaromatic compound transport system permease small subunit
MESMLRASRWIDAANRRLSLIATWMVLLSCVISAGNAASRYTINLSSNAWLEIQWYMFAVMFMLGASYTLCRNEHVRVDVIYGQLSTRTQIWIDLVGGILFLLPATIILTWLSWPMFLDSWTRGEMSSNANGLIRWPVKLFLPLGFALLTMQGFSEVVKRIAMLTGRMPANLHYERPLQ